MARFKEVELKRQGLTDDETVIAWKEKDLKKL